MIYFFNWHIRKSWNIAHSFVWEKEATNKNFNINIFMKKSKKKKLGKLHIYKDLNKKVWHPYCSPMIAIVMTEGAT